MHAQQKMSSLQMCPLFYLLKHLYPTFLHGSIQLLLLLNILLECQILDNFGREYEHPLKMHKNTITGKMEQLEKFVKR